MLAQCRLSVPSNPNTHPSSVELPTNTNKWCISDGRFQGGQVVDRNRTPPLKPCHSFSQDSHHIGYCNSHRQAYRQQCIQSQANCESNVPTTVTLPTHNYKRTTELWTRPHFTRDPFCLRAAHTTVAFMYRYHGGPTRPINIGGIILIHYLESISFSVSKVYTRSTGRQESRCTKCFISNPTRERISAYSAWYLVPADGYAADVWHHDQLPTPYNWTREHHRHWGGWGPQLHNGILWTCNCNWNQISGNALGQLMAIPPLPTQNVRNWLGSYASSLEVLHMFYELKPELFTAGTVVVNTWIDSSSAGKHLGKLLSGHPPKWNIPHNPVIIAHIKWLWQKLSMVHYKVKWVKAHQDNSIPFDSLHSWHNSMSKRMHWQEPTARQWCAK